MTLLLLHDFHYAGEKEFKYTLKREMKLTFIIIFKL